MRLHAVHLTDAELLLLDGHCGDKVQAEVTAARRRIDQAAAMPDVSPELASLVADVVSDALERGLVVWQHRRARDCRVCGKRAGYAKYQSGPRRGRENWDRPLTFAGVEMGDRFVRVENRLSLGACTDCAAEAKPLLIAALADVRAQVPPDLAEAGRPNWRRFDLRRCPKCGWGGHTGQMRQLPTVMPGGTYPGGCPACPFEHRLFGESFEIVDGFAVELSDV